MWWRLGLLAAGMAVLAMALFVPFATISIRVDLPPAAVAPKPSPGVELAAWWLVSAVGTFLAIGLLAVTAVLARWIVRRHSQRRAS